MTLILTAMTRRSVIQVADMRLTNVRTGRVEDESTAKMVAYAGRFVLSFAGPASMGREPTARWMTRVLSGVQDPDEILEVLADSAERIVKGYPPNIRGLAVVGAGWSGEPERSGPTYIQLTNFDFGSGTLLPGFQAFRAELKPHEKVLLLSAGVPVRETLVDEVQQLMRRRAGRRDERPAELVAMMLKLARSIAIGQRTVGTRFLVASIPGVPRPGTSSLASSDRARLRTDASRMTAPALAAAVRRAGHSPAGICRERAASRGCAEPRSGARPRASRTPAPDGS